MTRRLFSSTDLNHLQRQLSAWRQRQTGRTRLPDEVWEAAASLARSLGLSQVSRTLRLDYYTLGRRMAKRVALASGSPKAATFVELALGDPSGHERGQEYRVELADGNSRRMMLHLGRDMDAVITLAQAFWR